ncbi:MULTISPECIES: hypothetical protein [unclassified Streptomyces]|uniref:hypothetical protein n=1 Tax=unclassified Streptomyces TaxID=2593676 RepID=UPI001660123B|nr:MULTISPECIES: hypothetical protein [unclassified Streptomyces]MBD0710048.1 hypothetical protein [Streptomyces sp. CBMA291]MBD0715661.1 hypothetical protein [Streptomyces sp. CBMA370]
MKKSLAGAAAASAAALLLALPATASAAESTARTTSATTVQAPAASAAAVAATCTLKLYTPWKENIATSGVNDHARGSYETYNSCSGFALAATLQYNRWYGWSGLANTNWEGNRGNSILQWRCQGQGTFTYRMSGTVRGGVVSGDPGVGSGTSPERRFDC